MSFEVITIKSPPAKKVYNNRAGKSKSRIWKKFTKNGNFVKCDLCDSSFHHVTSGATTTLWSHLRRCHPEIDILNSSEKEEQPQQQAKCFFEKKLSAHKKRSLDELLTTLMVDAGLPFNILSSKALREFIVGLNPLYTPPCRQTFANSMLPTAIKALTDEIRTLIGSNSVALTADEWSSPNGNACLFSVTCHLVNENFERLNVVLAASSLAGNPHNAAHYSELIQKTLEKYNIPKKNLFALTSDGAAVMVKLKKDLQVDEESLHCYAHQLHLVVGDTFKKFEVLKESFRKMRIFVQKINKSSKARSTLKEMLRKAGLPERLPASPVVTRWNSYYQMAEDLFQSKDVIDRCIRDFDLETLRRAEWDAVEHILTPLRIFYQQTQMVSREDSTASEYLILSRLLRKELERLSDDETSSSQTYCEFLLSRVTSRFEDDWLRTSLRVSAFLDPRFCHSSVLFEDTEWKVIETEVLGYCDNFLPIDVYRSDSDEVGESNDTNNNEAHSEVNDSVFRLFDNQENAQLGRKRNRNLNVEAEVFQYVLQCQKERPASTESPFAWWKCNGHKYPVISHLARICLAVPATSVDSERLFSAAGLLYGNKLRNRLVGDKAEELLLLKLRPFRGLSRSIRTDNRRRKELFSKNTKFRYGQAVITNANSEEEEEELSCSALESDSEWEDSDCGSDFDI